MCEKSGGFGSMAKSIYASTTVMVEADTFGFSIINKGDDPVKVNNIVLKPYPPGQPDLSGESFTFTDPQHRTYNQNFEVNFEGVGTAPNLLLIQFFCAPKK